MIEAREQLSQHGERRLDDDTAMIAHRLGYSGETDDDEEVSITIARMRQALREAYLDGMRYQRSLR